MASTRSWIKMTIGIYCCLGIPFAACAVLPLLSEKCYGNPAVSTIANLKQVALAHQMYAVDNNNLFAPSGQWVNATEPYIRDTDLLCLPSAATASGINMAMNEAVSDHDARFIAEPGWTVLHFESWDIGRNLAGSHGKLPSHSSDQGRVYAAMVDGSAKRLPKQDTNNLIWKPQLIEGEKQ